MEFHSNYWRHNTAISRLGYILPPDIKLNFFKFGNTALSLRYGSFLHIRNNYIWVGYINCWHQGASIHIGIICIRGLELGENMLASQDTYCKFTCVAISLDCSMFLHVNVHQLRLANLCSYGIPPGTHLDIIVLLHVVTPSTLYTLSLLRAISIRPRA